MSYGRWRFERVVDSNGKVYRGKTGNTRYEQLYVTDGSIICNALGVYPSLTITALAFRIALDIVGKKKYLPDPVERP